MLLVGLVVVLQYQNWFGETGRFAIYSFAEQVGAAERRVALAEYRNRLLKAEVWMLKHSLGAVEARARTDLGMIKAGEVFYLVPDPSPR